MLANPSCYTCDEFLTRREIFYLYQCHTCFQKTPYCQKCNKTMDTLLNGIFFKCYICKVLTKIVHRESVSPESKNMVNPLYKSPNEIDGDVRCLFQPTLNVENNTPMRNLFNEGVFNPVNLNINRNFNNFNGIGANFVGYNPSQNLMENFNQIEVNKFNHLIQTPKSSTKFDNNLLFSPDERVQTPMTARNLNSGDRPINVRELGLKYSTPKSINKVSNSHHDDGITIEDFDKILINSQSTNRINTTNQSNNNISNNYSLLSSKNNRNGRIMGVNKVNSNNNENLLSSKKASVFAGYNKSEPRKSVSKSPLSLRKSKPKFGFPLTEGNNHNYNHNHNHNSSNSTTNYNNTSTNNLSYGTSNNPLNQSFILSNDKLNSSIVKFRDDAFHQPQKFGMASYLSEIKPVNNYNTQIDTSKFSFSTNDNFLKLSNISNFSNA